MSPAAYGVSVALGALACVLGCAALRRHRDRPGWGKWILRGLAVVLLADAVSYVVAEVARGSFSASQDLPLALCDVAVLVAAAASWWQAPLLVELTYFWGLAGTLQAVITPDLSSPFPHLAFFQYVVGHVAIVAAALFLVLGLGLEPRRGAVARVFAVTAGYTAFVGLVDAVTGADYMFLRSPPQSWTLLRVLGPWPWYVLSAAGVALVLIGLLDWPFRARRAAVARAGSLGVRGAP